MQTPTGRNRSSALGALPAWALGDPWAEEQQFPHSCMAGTAAHLISWKIKPHNLYSGKPPMQLSSFSLIQERRVKAQLPRAPKGKLAYISFSFPFPFPEKQFIWIFLDSSHQNQIQEREVILSTVLEKKKLWQIERVKKILKHLMFYHIFLIYFSLITGKSYNCHHIVFPRFPHPIMLFHQKPVNLIMDISLISLIM